MLDAYLVRIWSDLVESLRSNRANGLKSDENGVKTGQMTLKIKIKVTHSQWVLQAMLGAYLV